MSRTLYYRYLTPVAADACVGAPNYHVWYYSDDEAGCAGVLGTSATTRPANAYAAIAATTDDQFIGGEPVFSLQVDPEKDPLPPPPPPDSSGFSLQTYLADPAVTDFHASLVRDLRMS